MKITKASNECGGFKPAKGHLDTQMFPECEGTPCDRNIVKKTQDKRKKKSKKKAFNLNYHFLRTVLAKQEGLITDTRGNTYRAEDIKRDNAVVKAIKNDWNQLRESMGEAWNDAINAFANQYPNAYRAITEVVSEIQEEFRPKNRKITEIEKAYRNMKKWINYNFGSDE